MNPLRIAHKNQKAINRQKDPAFRKWAMELLAERIEQDRKKAAKKYGVDISLVKEFK